MGNPMPRRLAEHPRCGAYCRTTEQACRQPAMPNGRCKMHGGKATGRPITSGRYTKEADRKRREVRELLRGLRALVNRP